MTIAQLQNISLKINDETILSKISLNLKKNQITTLIGPNGGGKTSIARIILGILKPTSGKVKIEKNIKIGYMPQKLQIDKTLPLKARDFLKLTLKNPNFSHDFNDLIKTLNLEKILDKQIHHLSGGQLQKLIFLRSLINKPDLLVLDEPTQYMDVKGIEEFYKIIEQIRKKNNCTILLISHDLHMVMQKTDSIFCINNHLCCSGSPESVNEHPEYISLFGKKTNLSIYQHQHNHSHN